MFLICIEKMAYGAVVTKRKDIETNLQASCLKKKKKLWDGHWVEMLNSLLPTISISCSTPIEPN